MSVQAKHMDWHLHFFSRLPVPNLQPPAPGKSNPVSSYSDMHKRNYSAAYRNCLDQLFIFEASKVLGRLFG